jgi:hypothetical protein
MFDELHYSNHWKWDSFERGFSKRSTMHFILLLQCYYRRKPKLNEIDLNWIALSVLTRRNSKGLRSKRPISPGIVQVVPSLTTKACYYWHYLHWLRLTSSKLFSLKYTKGHFWNTISGVFSGFSLGSVFAEKIEFSWTAWVVAPPPPPTGGANTCTQ